MAREASAERNTKETEIKLKINLDGTGYSDIETGVGFFDHMLDGFTRHGLFDLSVRVHGDLQVDDHHTIEDTGIVLGTALKEAIGDKRGLSAMEAASFPWMNPWCSVRSICPEDLTLYGMQSLPQTGSVTCLRNGKRVLLCHFLCLWHESSYQGSGRWE